MDPKNVAVAYLEAISRKDLDAVAKLIAPNVKFKGPTQAFETDAELLAALRRIQPIHLRNEVKKIFTDGPEVCVIYDFVTNTAAGTLQSMEWLRIENGRVASVVLLFDRLQWKPALEELQRRA